MVCPTRTRSIRRSVRRIVLLLFLMNSPSVLYAEQPDALPSATTAPAAEDPTIKEAERAVRMRQPERAVEIWKGAAQRGLPEAAFRLGVAYRSGFGVEKDLDRATHWFERAARSGHHSAQFALGVFHQNGTGVARNRDEAMRLFGLASRGGHRKAKEHLARVRAQGKNAYATADARILANRADPRGALALAIGRNDPGSAREALSRGAPINGAPGDLRHWKPLVLAIQNENPAMVKILLEHRADPNQPSRSGELPLILAIHAKQREILRMLLRAGAQPNARATNGSTPLMEAARLGRTGSARDLIAAGADPTIVLADGTSAAGLARRFGHTSLFRELKKRGAPAALDATKTAERLAAIERRSSRTGGAEGSTLPPVVEAARRGDVELLREMVDQGNDLGVSDPEGRNALSRAAAGGHAEAVRLLLSAGVDPDLPERNGETPLMRAVASDSEGTDAVVEILLDAGADPHARDSVGQGVIEYSVTGATKKKLELLLAAGGSWTPSTVQNVLGRAAASGQVERVEAFLPFASDPETRTQAICRATEQAHLEILELLVAGNASLDSSCGEGRTALVIAAHDGQLELAEKLIDAGAGPDGSPPDRDTALVAAAARGHAELVAQLLREGADVNRRGARRMTALMAASAYGHTKIVEALLRAGAKPGMRSDTEQTALDLARQSGDSGAVAALESHRSGWQDWFGEETN
jgi:ankyrin repeat protein